MIELPIRSTSCYRLLRRVQRPWRRYAAQKALGDHTAFAQRLLETLIRDGQVDSGGSNARILRVLRTSSDVIVMLIGDLASSEASKVLKLPLTSGAKQSTAAHRKAVMTLHQLPNLEPFCASVPKSLAWGEFDGQTYYLETALPGIAAGDLVRKRTEPASLILEAAHAIRPLHLATRQYHLVDEAIFKRMAGDNLDTLRRLAPGWPDAALLVAKLDDLETLLRQGLFGERLPFSWSHGDYWPGNILVLPESGSVSGIVDWDRASVKQMPLLDILHLFAYTHKMRRRIELGEEIVRYLLPAAFTDEERALVDETLEQLDLPRTVAFGRTVALLYWLQFATTNLTRYPSFQRDHVWMRDNVFLVLKRGLS